MKIVDVKSTTQICVCSVSGLNRKLTRKHISCGMHDITRKLLLHYEIPPPPFIYTIQFMKGKDQYYETEQLASCVYAGSCPRKHSGHIEWY